MTRLVYIHQDGREFETDSFEQWKIEGYMAALGATAVDDDEWLMANGMRVKALPDLPPARVKRSTPKDPLTGDAFKPNLSRKRKPNIFVRWWLKYKQKWAEGRYRAPLE